MPLLQDKINEFFKAVEIADFEDKGPNPGEVWYAEVRPLWGRIMNIWEDDDSTPEFDDLVLPKDFKTPHIERLAEEFQEEYKTLCQTIAAMETWIKEN